MLSTHDVTNIVAVTKPFLEGLTPSQQALCMCEIQSASNLQLEIFNLCNKKISAIKLGKDFRI